MVPKILTFEQQATRKNVCTDILDAIKNDPNSLEKVITCDESWFFTYDPETKRQSMHWKTPTSPRAKKARMSKSKFKAMMIVFFDIHGIVYLHWVPEGQTINQHYYLEVLGNLRERIRKKRPEMWKEKSWIFHQDNAPAHSALSVKRFLAKHSIPVLEHPPYSPDLASCDFYLFPKVKSALKRTRFESVEAVKEKAARVLKELTKNDFQHCFEQWKIRMERCMDREGVYTLKAIINNYVYKIRIKLYNDSHVI
ncbi:mariner Mos1 transposase [Trichonephila clavipes]|nr:mariner Mos1 transposase [Trichonephila clavipes]